MKLKVIAANQTVLEHAVWGSVFYSYNTPVAALVDGKFYRTAKKWGVTTTRHINQWLDGAKAEEKPQEYFDNLI